MPHSIGRDEVQRLIADEDAQVAEVLAQPEYEWSHIEGAVHLPFDELSAELTADRLHPHRPIIVYCNNHQ